MAAPKKKPSWLLETDSKELNGMSFDDVMNKASLPFKPTAHLEDGTPKPWKFVPRDPQEEKDEELFWAVTCNDPEATEKLLADGAKPDGYRHAVSYWL